MTIQNSSESSAIPIFLVFLFVVVTFAFIQRRLTALRREEMQELARICGLQYLGNCLPPEYLSRPPRATPFWGARNVVFGQSSGELILAYDTDVPSGRTSASMTVVARRWNTPPSTPYVHKSLRGYDHGRWRSVYLAYGFLVRPTEMSPQMIEGVWAQLKTSFGPVRPRAPRAATSTEILIHPRKRLN